MYRVVLAACLALAVPDRAAAAESGKARTEALVAAFKQVKTVDGKLATKDKAANDKAFAALDGFFDYGVLTTRPLEPKKDRFKPEELTSVQQKFRDLIRLIAYPSAGDFFTRARLSWQPEAKKDGVVSVPLKLRLEDEDLDMVVEFQWAGTPLRIVDVLFDGDSLIKDYQNQLGRIVDKSGVPGLVKALDNRRAELDKATR